jgi:AraC-like DNA-binding protein
MKHQHYHSSPQENFTFVSMPFYCQSCGTHILENNRRIRQGGAGNHHAVLYWCVEGSGTIKLYGQSWQMEPGDALFYLPGEDQELIGGNTPWHVAWIGIKGPFTEALLLSYGYSRFIKNAGPYPEKLFKEIQHYLPINEPYAIRHLASLVLEAWALIGGKDSTHTPYREQEIGKRFVQIVNTHFQDPELNVESIADMMGIHPSTLTRKVKKELCRTPYNYLISYRAQQGLTLLSGTNLPVSEVARQCGLPDKTHFYTIVRKSVGMSPTEYREQEQQAK